MQRHQWKVRENHPDATDELPFAIVTAKEQLIALVKTAADAHFMAKAARNISSLESTASRNRAMYFGQTLRR